MLMNIIIESIQLPAAARQAVAIETHPTLGAGGGGGGAPQSHGVPSPAYKASVHQAVEGLLRMKSHA